MTQAPQMYDIKGPVQISSGAPIVIILIILFIIAAAAAAILLKRKTVKEALRKRLAHEIAYEQLEELRKKDYIRQGKVKEYYIEISGIVRHYLERRFDIKAPEMTTEEFLAGARESSRLAGEHKAPLEEFLVCCDLVKFAKYLPSQAEIDAVFDSAKRFVDQTREQEAPK